MSEDHFRRQLLETGSHQNSLGWGAEAGVDPGDDWLSLGLCVPLPHSFRFLSLEKAGPWLPVIPECFLGHSAHCTFALSKAWVTL